MVSGLILDEMSSQTDIKDFVVCICINAAFIMILSFHLNNDNNEDKLKQETMIDSINISPKIIDVITKRKNENQNYF